MSSGYCVKPLNAQFLQFDDKVKTTGKSYQSPTMQKNLQRLLSHADCCYRNDFTFHKRARFIGSKEIYLNSLIVVAPF